MADRQVLAGINQFRILMFARPFPQFSDPSLTTPAKLSSLLERIRLDLIRKVIPQQPQPSSSNSGSNSLLGQYTIQENFRIPVRNCSAIFFYSSNILLNKISDIPIKLLGKIGLMKRH